MNQQPETMELFLFSPEDFANWIANIGSVKVLDPVEDAYMTVYDYEIEIRYDASLPGRLTQAVRLFFKKHGLEPKPHPSDETMLSFQDTENTVFITATVTVTTYAHPLVRISHWNLEEN